jgi:RNA polymerase sigma-70 factor (ECF subfamily)
MAADGGDLDLVQRCRRGDQDACRQLYTEHGPRVLAYLRRSGFDPATADDLLQETFARVFRSLGTFDPQRGSLRGWVVTIARNVARRHWRRQDPGGWFDPELAEQTLTETDNPHLAGQRQEEVQALDDCVRALDEDLARLIRLRYVEGRTTRGIAEEADIPEATVRLRLSVAMERLERCMKGKGFTGD